MTHDGKTPDLPEWVRMLLNASASSTRRPTSSSAAERILAMIGEAAAAIKAADVEVPDDLSGVYDNPGTSPEKQETAGPLPALRAGVYKHWKGSLYNVLGYARDASNSMPKGFTVVVYTPLNTRSGPTMFVRVVDEFLGRVCTVTGLSEKACNLKVDHDVDFKLHRHELVDRFTYLGPEVPEV